MPEVQASSDEFERKLWLDYVTKINDRDLQSAHAYGITPWALVAVAGAIIYRSVPQIPAFWATPGMPTAGLAVFLLEADFLFHFLAFFVFLIFYCASGIEARLMPEQNIRAARVKEWFIRALLIISIVAHLGVARALGGPAFVRWVLALFGLFWFSNLVRSISDHLKRVREAKKSKLPVPEFSSGVIGPNVTAILAAAIMGPIASVSMTTLLLLLRQLHQGGGPWLLPLAAGTQFLIVSVIMTSLFFWGIGAVSRGVYLSLERDVLLQNLSASEIRSRFIREAVGPGVGEWLQELEQKHRDVIAKIGELTNSFRPKVEEIESIDTSYPLERAGRAKNLLKELNEAFKLQVDHLRTIFSQLKQVAKTSPSKREMEILLLVLDQLNSEGERLTGVAGSAGQLRARLENLAKETQKA